MHDGVQVFVELGSAPDAGDKCALPEVVGHATGEGTRGDGARAPGPIGLNGDDDALLDPALQFTRDARVDQVARGHAHVGRAVLPPDASPTLVQTALGESEGGHRQRGHRRPSEPTGHSSMNPRRLEKPSWNTPARVSKRRPRSTVRSTGSLENPW